MMPVTSSTAINFDEVLESCRRFLLTLAMQELPPDLQAKGGVSDLVQQTFVQAVLCEHQFRGQTMAELRGWLRSILRTEAAVFRRQYLQTAARDVKREVAISPFTPDDRSTPEASALQSECAQRTSDALTRLSAEQRQIMVLRLEDDLSFTEIGERTGKSPEAVRKLFTRALDRLRGQLADDADEPS